MASMLDACRANQGLPAKLTAGSRVGYDLSKVGAGVSRGFNGKKKLEAAPWSGTWPAPGATLDLDFANNRGFVRGLGQGGVMDAITFTRASAGWYVDQNGTLVEAAISMPRFDWASTAQVLNKNLLYGTESLGIWFANSAISVQANATIAPNGISTADKLVETATTQGDRFNSQSFAGYKAESPYTLSFYMKAAGRNFGYLAVFNGERWAGRFFDLTTGQEAGAYIGVGGTFISTDAGNGWWKIKFTVNGASTYSIGPQYRLGFAPTASSGSYTGDGISGVFVWGLQAEFGTEATEYEPVAQPTTITPLATTPTCNGLLIEKPSTNQLLWCRDATQSNWVKTGITAAKDQIGIDGVANAASSLTATADGGTCVQTITMASGSYTNSVFLKRLNGSGAIQVSLDGTTWSTVALSSDEWRRVVMTGTVTNPVISIRMVVPGDSVAMDFAQVENSVFVTSPILTTTASATRAKDDVLISSTYFDGFYNQSEGSWFVKTYTMRQDNARQGILGMSNELTMYLVGRQLWNFNYVTPIILGIINPSTINVIALSFRGYGLEWAYTPEVGKSDVYRANARQRFMRIGAESNGNDPLTSVITQLVFIPKPLGRNQLIAHRHALL